MGSGVLTHAFEAREVRPGSVGTFGDDVPASLLAAHGLCGTDVAFSGSDVAPVPVVSEITEPFMDPRSSAFLHRLAAGAFDGLSGIVFCRDDQAALPAYQYATELRRQGRLADTTPPFFLWNLLHSEAGPATAFNTVQAERLNGWLSDRSGGAPLPGAKEQAQQLARLNRAQAEARVSGGQAMIWRAAGRWMAPADHADALAEALETLDPPRSGRRIALVGGACDRPAVYGAIEAAGPVVCDLTQLGGHGPALTGHVTEDLAAIATDPLHPRGVPAARYRPTLLQRILEARCDLVVAQLDETDHSFGWDLPSLREALAGRGVPLVNLGFRPLRPGAEWCAMATRAVEGEFA